ncbi:DUF924 family protein [Oceanospirillum sp. RT-1-3]|uniref:DUF924 family protein n=1 Tax=unclassified Halobacteriovorax TaxID=2639665 RepID=UPI00399A969A
MYHEVLDFWFDELTEEQKWMKDARIDREIEERFGRLHTKAAKGELFEWREEHLGRLAEIIILDQFSRNIYRGDARSFASDDMALVLAQEAILQKADEGFTTRKKHFLYMPYMHSESLTIQKEGLRLFEKLDNDMALQYMHQHMAIIERFGRYPHRNGVLGRESTPEEIEFLKMPNSSF